MKHKLLSLVALAGALFMSTSAKAQSWTEPVVVDPAIGEATAPADGGIYFLYNEATDLYLGAGNDWGTHVVATTVNEAYPATFWNENIGLSSSQAHALPIQLAKAESGNWYLIHMGTNKGGDKYLTSEDGNSWIDGGTGRRIDFIITETTGGYTIQATNTVEAGTFLGIAEGDADHDDISTLAINVMNTIAAGDERAVWQFLSTNYVAWNAYNARVKLFELYEEIVDAGYDVDLAAAKTVYDNANATAEQLEAATTELRRLYNKVKFQDVFQGASEDNPIDVTDACLVNPNFDSNIDGWTITVVGQNLQWQARTDGNVDESKNYVQITNFIEAWRPSDQGALGDGTISQTQYDMPAGKYMLECDAMATRQGGLNGLSAEEAVEGAYIFIQGANHEVLEPIKSPDYQPKHWSVVFVNDDSEWLTFGLKVENTTANWISADNFRLTYYGKTSESPELVILKDALKKAQELADESEENNLQSYDNNNYSAEARSGLAAAIANAESAISGDAAAQVAATEALKAAIEAVNASKKDYAQFKAIYEESDNTLQKLSDAGQWNDLQNDIDVFLQEFENEFNAGSLTAADLEEYQNKVSNMVRDYISDPSKIQEGDDLSFLIVNPHFTTGTTSDPTGWTINSGSMTELRLSTHNIETWHKTFDISQTIPNMPAGVYDITLQGFVRHDNSGDTESTWLYGGISKVHLISLFDDETQMRAEPIWGSDSDKPALNDGNRDMEVSGMYVPNGMTGSYYWFQEINPNTGEPYYTNHVKVILDKDGDLTIGIHSEAAEDWVIFDNFGIKYAGQDMSLYYDMIKKKQDELQLLYDEKGVAVSEDVLKIAQEKVAFNANTVETPEAALAMINEIDEVIKQVNECVAIYDEVAGTWEYLNTLANSPEVVSVSDSYITLLSTVEGNKDAGYKTIQAMRDDQAKLAAGWAAAVTQDIEAGDDVSFAILNPHYTNLEGTGASDLFWTSTSWHGTGGNGDAASFACEFFNYRAADAETGNNLEFRHYQELNGIKPGYYEVSVQGFYRYGNYNPNTDFGTPGAGYAHADGTEELNAVMFVSTSAGNDGVALKSIFDGAQSDMVGVGSEVEAEGVSGVYIPNDMAAATAYFDQGFYPNVIAVQVGEDGNLTLGISKAKAIDSDWTIFTDWKLKYLGTTAPDAVQDLNAKTTGNAVIYSIDGRQQSQLRRGINIVRQNGAVNKVLVK